MLTIDVFIKSQFELVGSALRWWLPVGLVCTKKYFYQYFNSFGSHVYHFHAISHGIRGNCWQVVKRLLKPGFANFLNDDARSKCWHLRKNKAYSVSSCIECLPSIAHACQASCWHAVTCQTPSSVDGFCVCMPRSAPSHTYIISLQIKWPLEDLYKLSCPTIGHQAGKPNSDIWLQWAIPLFCNFYSLITSYCWHNWLPCCSYMLL